VEGSEEAVAAVVAPQGDLPGSHQVVPVVQARRAVHGLEALLHPVADPLVRLEPARSSDFPGRTEHPLSLMVLERALVLAFWGDSAGVGSLDPLPIGTAGGAVVTTAQPPVEAIPLIRWSRPWQRGRNWELLVVVSPSGSMFVGLAGGVGARDGDSICSGEVIASSTASSGTSVEVPSLALRSRRRYSLAAMNSHVEVLSTFFK
jgi:hypothetical protein